MSFTLEDIAIDGKKQKAGFNFLRIQHKTVPRWKTSFQSGYWGRLLDFKLIISPAKEKIKAHKERIKETILSHKKAPQVALIGKLNPIIRGWANYYSSRSVISSSLGIICGQKSTLSVISL